MRANHMQIKPKNIKAWQKQRIKNRVCAETLSEYIAGDIQPLIEAAEKRGIDMGVVACEGTCASLIEAARKEAYKEVGKYIRKEISEERLAELLDINFFELDALLRGELPKGNDNG